MIPLGLAADGSGNVFIADWGNSIIRKVDTHGILTTVAGNPFNVSFLGDGNTAAFGATLIQPRGVAVDTLGNIYVADTGAPPDSDGGRERHHQHNCGRRNTWV